MYTYGFFFAWLSLNLHLWMAQWPVLNTWFLQVFLSQWLLWQNHTYFLCGAICSAVDHCSPFVLCPLHADNFLHSLIFADIIYCKWWDIQSLSSFVLFYSCRTFFVEPPFFLLYFLKRCSFYTRSCYKLTWLNLEPFWGCSSIPIFHHCTPNYSNSSNDDGICF